MKDEGFFSVTNFINKDTSYPDNVLEETRIFPYSKHIFRIVRTYSNKTLGSNQSTGYISKHSLLQTENEELISAIFDYYEIPKDLTFKQRIAYYELLGN